MARAALLLLLALVLAGCASPPPAAPSEPSPTTFEGARFVTEAGEFLMVLFPDDARQTVALYRDLIGSGYFVGKEFGRIVPGHVIQILDMVGAAGSTATEDPRRVPLEPSPRLNFSMGAVGISRGDDPNSGGPEFFIMDYATSHLWGNYTVFGQLVEGIGVVHEIARMPAVETPRAVPAANAFLSDRTAIDPVRITAAELTNVTLTAEQAAKLPARVGRNVRDGDLRHSLEWPADLAAGRASELVWYLRPYNGTAAPDPSDLTLRVTGPSGDDAPMLRPEPRYPEILHFTWTPRAAGPHDVTLSQGSRALATIAVDVPAR